MGFTENECDDMFCCLDFRTKKEIINIILELKRAENKHPVWPDDYIHKAALVSEESGELIRATIQYQHENGEFVCMREEVVQVGVTAIRFLKNI